MNKTYYVCKYTPIELLEAFGGECQNLNEMPQGFDHADQIAIRTSADSARLFWKL